MAFGRVRACQASAAEARLWPARRERWPGLCCRVAGMHATGHRWDWVLSCALFGAILLALIVAALALDPLSASLP